MDSKAIIKTATTNLKTTCFYMIKSSFNASFKAVIQYKKERKKQLETKSILFETERGERISGLPYALFLQLAKDERYKDFEFVWVVNDKHNYRINELVRMANIKICKRDTAAYARALARCKFLVTDATFPPYFVKRDDQVYVNTFCPSVFKSKNEIEEIGQHKTLSKNLLQADYFVSPNRYISDIVMKQADVEGIYQGDIVEESYHAAECIFSEADKLAFEKQIGKKLDGKKVVLYAPVWRNSMGRAAELSEEIIKNTQKLQKQLMEEYIVVLRAFNPVIKYMEENPKDYGIAILPEMFDEKDLLCLADVLVTDYANIYMNALALDKPIVFYTYDLNEYKKSKNYTDEMCKKIPGPVCTTIKETVNSIKRIDTLNDEYKDLRENVKSCFCSTQEGDELRKLIDIVFHRRETKNVRRVADINKKNILIVADLNSKEASDVSLLNQVVKLSYNIDYSSYNLSILLTGKFTNNKEEILKVLNKETKVFYSFGLDVCGFAQYFRNNTNTQSPVLERIKAVEDYEENYTLFFNGLIGNVPYDCVIVSDKFSMENIMALKSKQIPKKIVLIEKEYNQDKDIPLQYLKDNADILITDNKKLAKKNEDMIFMEFKECYPLTFKLAQNRMTDLLGLFINTVNSSASEKISDEAEGRIINQYDKALERLELKANELDDACKLSQKDYDKQMIEKICELI